ncbi:hypothetical protein BLOT_002888 [Blomia tropicalis]|nr:hypothetical protein BLOT_002888 [Blomia tropicalis]
MVNNAITESVCFLIQTNFDITFILLFLHMTSSSYDFFELSSLSSCPLAIFCVVNFHLPLVFRIKTEGIQTHESIDMNQYEPLYAGLLTFNANR